MRSWSKVAFLNASEFGSETAWSARSSNVRAHAVHVAASSDNTADRTKQLIALSEKVIKPGLSDHNRFLVLALVPDALDGVSGCLKLGNNGDQ